jgi:hypothetical protein
MISSVMIAVSLVASSTAFVVSGADATTSSDTFAAIACAPGSAVTCLAVGSSTATGHGVIARTSSSGAAWTWSSVPAKATKLTGVACATAKLCTAVGGEGGLYSTNGGKKWSKSTFPSANIAQANLTSVACPTRKVCIAVAFNWLSAGVGLVFRSTDGGSTWTSSSGGGGVPAMGAVACETSSSCAAVGTGVYVTSNRGKAWTEKGVAGGIQGLTGISCESSTYCVAVGANFAGISNPSAAGDAVTTTDGGSTWQDLSGFPASTSTVQHVACATGGACFAAGPGASGSDPAVLVSQATSSSSWAVVTTPAGLTGITALTCPTASTCLVVGTTAASAEELAVGTLMGGSYTWTVTALAP